MARIDLKSSQTSKQDGGWLVEGGGRILIEQQRSFPLRDDEVDGG